MKSGFFPELRFDLLTFRVPIYFRRAWVCLLLFLIPHFSLAQIINKVQSSQEICAGITSPQMLTTQQLSGGSSLPYKFQWFQSTSSGGPFTTPASAAAGFNNGENYQPPILNTSTYYQRRVISGVDTSFSNTVFLIVDPKFTLNAIIYTGPSLCKGSKAAVIKDNGIAGGVPSPSISWWVSKNGSSFTLITGANSPSYQPDTLNSTTYFYRLLSTPGGCISKSTTVRIPVYIPPDNSNAGPDQVLCGQISTKLQANIPINGMGTWSQVQGPSVTFDNIALPGATISGLTTAGTYQFQWTITNGPCTPSQSQVSITRNDPLTIINTKITDVACGGNPYGSVIVQVTGGLPPYTFSTDGGPIQANDTIKFLLAGTHIITIHDAKSCLSTDTVMIKDLAPAILLAPGHADASCGGKPTGTAWVTATGGAAPYTYLWTPSSQTTDTVRNLKAGTYGVVVRDKLGCSKGATVIINDASTPVKVSLAHTDISCTGGASGKAVVTATGGVAPYTYLWQPTGQTTDTARNLAAGQYVVFTTDVMGCTRSDTVNISVVSPLSIAITKRDVVCNGMATGAIAAQVTGGALPYLYAWSVAGVHTANHVDSLKGGTYTLTVTDAAGCSQTNTVTIFDTVPKVGVKFKVQNVACAGSPTGSVTAMGSGGKSPYTYFWLSSKSTAPLQAGLKAGWYAVAITDASGCSAIDSVQVMDINAPFLLTITGVKDVSGCNGAANGHAVASVSGGVKPYLVTWNTTPVQHTDTAKQLIAGTYMVTAIDSLGCSQTGTVTIKDLVPPLKTIVAITGESCDGKIKGTANVMVTGGTPPYTYAWNTSPVKTTAYIDSLQIGKYIVTISDSNGCSASASATIRQNGTVLTVNDNVNDPYNTPVTFNVLTNDLAAAGTIDSATVDLDPNTLNIQQRLNVSGKGVFQVDNKGNVTFTPAPGFSGTVSTSYTVNNLNGCPSNQAIITVHVFSATQAGVLYDLIIPNVFTPDGDGINDQFSIRGLEKYPDNTIQIFNRWGSQVYHVHGYMSSGQTWNGNGLNDGAYFYVLEVTISGQKKIIGGYTTILRAK